MDDERRKSENGKESPTRGEELDAFWNIADLLPERPERRTQNARTAARRNVTPAAVDIELDPHPAGRTETVGDSAFSRTGDAETAGGQPGHRAEPTDPAAAAAGRPQPYAERFFGASARTQSTQTQPARTETGAPHPETGVIRPSIPAETGTLQDAGIGVTHYVPPHTADELRPEHPPVDEYTPDGVLIHTVRVFEWQSNYHYFDQFTQDALRMARVTPPDGAPPRREPFFSYFPQYAQLNRRQAAWYVWWRAQTGKKSYPDTDYAYILLYIFELINLPASPDEAAAARDRMAEVWIAYRKRFPQLDHYMCEWMCDYCLIHRLTAPVDRLAPALDDIITQSRLKEFYLTAALTVREDAGGADQPVGGDLDTARILLRHCCQYDYRKSKFASGEHKATFDSIIPSAVAAVLPLLLGRNGQKPLITMQDTVMTRDAFTGALCSYRNKRRIEVSYTSFSRSHDLRFLIGDMVKHTENRLRGWIGVRSRLSVMSLPIPVRDALDEWLNPRAPARAALPAQGRPEERPEYERLYDLPAAPVSLSHADEIEQTSWETTRRLTEAFGGEEPDEPETPAPDAAVPPRSESAPAETPTPAPDPQTHTPAPAPQESAPAVDMPMAEMPPAEQPSDDADGPLSSMPEALAAFVRLALAGDYDGQHAYARERHRMTDAVADEINDFTAASDLGDIILEGRGDGTYDVAEDYRDMVADALSAD